MKILWSLFALSLLSGGCQQMKEYYTEKSVISDCGISKESSELTGYLNFCGQQFTNPSLTIATSCLNRAVTVLPKLAPDCRSKYELRVKNSVASILIAHMEGIKDPAATTGEPLTYETGARLFARWYNASKVLYPDSYSDSSKTEPGSFQAAFYTIFASFKKKVVNLMAANGLLAFESDSKSGVDKSAERLAEVAGIQAAAMFEEGATELAVETLLPSLQSTADRAEVLLSIYNISCKLARCVPAIDDNARYQLVQLMSSYLDKEKLNKAMSAAKSVPSSLKTPFAILLKNADKIDDLISSGNASKQPVITDFKGAGWTLKRNALRSFISYPSSPTLTRFVRLSARFADLDEDFLATRSFGKRATERLAYNPSDESITLITSTMKSLNDSLENELKELADKKKELLATYRDLVKLDSDSLAFDADRLSLDLADALNDLDVMRQSLSDGRERRATSLREATAIASQKSDTFVVQESRFLTVGTKDSIYDGKSNWGSLEEISLQDISYVAENDNELIALAVSGEWHPVCALKQSPLAGFASESVMTGPGGYQLSVSNSSALVNARGKERREVDYTDMGVKAEVCAQTPPAKPVSASVCGYYQVGKRIEKTKFETETESNTTQSVAAFEAGLRLPNTPFPNLPAGALVGVVEEPAGQGFNPVKFLVAGKESVVVLKKGQKLRFVANDCESTDSSGTLKVEISPRISTAEASTSLLQDFSAILFSQEINARKDKIVQDGSSIEPEIQSLRSYILKNFAEKHAGDADYRQIPLVAAVFDAWLDQDMMEVRKRFDIRMQERKARDIDLQYKAFSSRMNAEVRSEKIQAEIFEVSLANLEQNLLSDRLLRILDFTDTSLMPLIDLYYPGLKIDSQFKDLNSMPLNSSLKNIGDKLNSTFKQISSDVLVKALYRNTGGIQYQNLVVRIPRPEEDVEDSEWPVANMTIRQKVWDYLRDKKAPFTFSLEIPVESLYQRTRIKGRLSCNQILPVIDSSMIGFTLTKDIGATKGLLDDMNGGAGAASLRVGPRIQFATVGGAVDYRIINGTVNSSQISDIPVNYALNVSGLVDRLNLLTTTGVATHAAYGYSPFGDFNFEGLDLVRNYTVAKAISLDGVGEMVLLYRAKVNSTQNKPLWIGGCADGT